jgi:hypothetical protein
MSGTRVHQWGPLLRAPLPDWIGTDRCENQALGCNVGAENIGIFQGLRPNFQQLKLNLREPSPEDHS